MSSGPIVLSLETATMGGSVFLGQGSDELATRLGDPKVSHSNSLIQDISDVLSEAKLALNDVELLACASGPGSFTGLRIGIATLKALAATLELPCTGIPTLEAVAHAGGPSDATVALLPAGRGELFSQMFAVSDMGIVTAIDDAVHISPSRLVDKYAQFERLTWAGSGAHAQRTFLMEQAQGRGITFSDNAAGAEFGWKLAPEVTNLARHVAALALQSFEGGVMQSADSLSAIYVRPSDAELNQPCQ